MYQANIYTPGAGSNNNRSKKRPPDPQQSAQLDQEQKARRRSAPQGSSKVELPPEQQFAEKVSTPPSTRSLVQGNRFSQNSREFVVNRLTSSLANISVTSNPFRTHLAVFFITQLGSQSAPSN